MKRDFTTENYERFCSMIRQEQSEQWSGITDWIGDRYLDVKHWLGDLGLYDKMADIDRYHREILDKENTSIAKIGEIFEEVSRIDALYTENGGPNFGHVHEVLGQYSQYAMKLADISVSVQNSIQNGAKLEDCFNPDVIHEIMSEISRDLQTTLNKIWFTADTFGSISDAYKQDYVNDIELSHPEYKELLDKALSDEDISDEERRDIKFIAYSAPEPYRSIYLEHLKEYVIDVREFMIDENGKKVKQGSYYTWVEKKIYLGDDSENFNGDPCSPYNTVFHESGHLIDDSEKNGDGDFMTRGYQYEGKSMYDWIMLDAREYVNDYIDKEMPGISDEERKQLLRSLNLSEDAAFAYGGDADGLSQLQIDRRNKILNHMNGSYNQSGDLEGDDNSSASDIFGGITNNALKGDWGHTKQNYWYTDGTPSHKQESELWAEFFAAKMTHDEAELESLRRHFPHAYEAMEKMAEEMADVDSGLSHGRNGHSFGGSSGGGHSSGGGIRS